MKTNSDALTKHVKSEHPVYKLSDASYEALREKAMDDADMQTRFIECYASEFLLWCAESSIRKDFACDQEMAYIESEEETYLQFAYDQYLKEATSGHH